MSRLQRSIALAATATALVVDAERESPVAKVITLLTDLKAEVMEEGKTEAGTYDTFACFCKDQTATKSESITSGQDNIDGLSASIQADTAEQAEKEAQLMERKTKQSELAGDLKDTVTRCTKEAAEYEAKAADLSKAIKSLEGAIKTLSGSKPGSLLKIKDAVKQSLALAGAMNVTMAPKQQDAVQALLQKDAVDPDDPEYGFHSGGIIEMLEKLEKEFNDEKTATDSEFEKAKGSCDELKSSLTGEMKENNDAMDALKEDIEGLKTTIAENRESLVEAESLMQDDKVYLKDITVRCEVRAKEYDQRSQMRADEVEALAQALEILEGKVKDLDEVNKREALLVKKALLHQVNLTTSVNGTTGAHTAPKAASAKGASAAAEKKAVVSFMQTEQSRRLRGVAAHGALKLEQAQRLLKEAGERLGKPEMSALAEKIAADPFLKVKQMIQNLIEKVLDQAKADAEKKGFCDTEVGKAKSDRDYRAADIEKLTAELTGLEAKKDELKEKIDELKLAANETATALDEAEKIRDEEHEANLEAIKKAREGSEAVAEAISLLRTFYKAASHKNIGVAGLLQQSPVDADDPGAGFEGGYRGSQESSAGILGLLEVIKSDFDRTLHETQALEKNSAADHVEFDRSSKADIADKTKGQELNAQDLETTKATIEQKVGDLEDNQKVLDSALKAIEDLKPMCFDSVMSYEEKVAKREEEVAALKKAICYLDPDATEEECA